jgi:competence protein ComEA
VESLSRPEPSGSRTDRARDWVEWFGTGRLVAAVAATVAVCAGGWWLVRSPVPPVESTLPVATPSTTLVGSGTTAAPGGPQPAVVASAVVVVHVAGAVVAPGVYELVGPVRVHDAVLAAGGPTGDADRDALNLAAPVPDGSRVYVPVAGEAAPSDLVSSPTGAAAGPVDVNRAEAGDLEALPGVGPATAAAIVTERERNGPFLTVDDLERVPGIGPAKLDALRDLVTT